MLVTVALANKMARIVWALLVKQENYKAPVAAKACTLAGLEVVAGVVGRGSYGATVGETGLEERDYSSCLEHAFMIWFRFRELPYGPAAPSLHQRPDRWQHPTMRQPSSKTAETVGRLR